MLSEPFVQIKIPDVLNLEAIAAEYGIAVQEIVDFHNAHCRLHELLPRHLPKYVEYIYLPAEVVTKRREELLAKPQLSLPKKLGFRRYGIILKYLPKDLNIHYSITAERTTDDILVFQKDQTWVNNQEIEKQVESLVETASRALYPLEVKQNNDGTFSKINNSGEILERWQEIREGIQQYYVGTVAEEIIKEVDASFIELSKNNYLFAKNIFFNLFSLPLYRYYHDFRHSQSISIYFPAKDMLAEYDAEFSLDKEYTRSHKIALRIKGEETDNIFKKNDAKGKIDLLYKFHRETHEIFSITGILSYHEGEKEYSTEIGIFELD